MNTKKVKVGRKPFYPAMVEMTGFNTPIKFRSTKESLGISKAIHFYNTAKKLGYDAKMKDCQKSVVIVTLTGQKHKSAKKAK